MLVYILAATAAVALAASLFVSVRRPFRFKDNGSGPDCRPSAAVAGGLMMIAVIGFVVAFTL